MRLKEGVGAWSGVGCVVNLLFAFVVNGKADPANAPEGAAADAAPEAVAGGGPADGGPAVGGGGDIELPIAQEHDDTWSSAGDMPGPSATMARQSKSP